jgi:capsular exopolysaccharide synthesis family protein
MNSNEKTIDLVDVAKLLWSKIWLILLITAIGGAGAFAFSKFTIPKKYSSHISMYVQSYKDVSESVNLNAQQTISGSKQLVNTYIEVMKDDAVMNAVGELLLEKYSVDEVKKYLTVSNGKITPASIRSCLSISTVTDTSAVKVTATTLNAELAADICNSLTAVAPKYVEEAVGVGAINTIDVAKVYPSVVSPNNTKNAILGALAAFVIICMIIIVIDMLDNTIKDSNTISKKYKKAIIGEIMQFGETKKKKKGGRRSTEPRGLLTDKDVPFNVVESYKTIRTNILFTAADSEKKVIAVSSSNPGEGKSTSAANLAIALAQTGSTVLVVDADMRKPVMHRTFKVKNDEGLSTLIIKKSTLENSIKPCAVPKLDILPSGPLPPNPSELLASASFKNLIEMLSKKYEYVIIDTPPVNVVSDAMVIKDAVTGIMLVVRYALTTYDELSACMKQINLAQANVLGFVMNDVHHRRSAAYYNNYKYKYKKYGYGGYGYGYGYGYRYGNNPSQDADDDNEEKAEEKPVEKTVEKKNASKKA